MLRIFVCSALRGNIMANRAIAAEHCRRIAQDGAIPFAPHLFYTAFLNDEVEAERRLGMTMGRAELARCDEMHVFGAPTTGMAEEITLAVELRIPIRWFDAEGRAV